MSALPPERLRRLTALCLLAAYAAGCATPCGAAVAESKAEGGHHHEMAADPGHGDGATGVALRAPCECGCERRPAAPGSAGSLGYALRLASLEAQPSWPEAPVAEPPTGLDDAPPGDLDPVPIELLP